IKLIRSHRSQCHRFRLCNQVIRDVNSRRQRFRPPSSLHTAKQYANEEKQPKSEKLSHHLSIPPVCICSFGLVKAYIKDTIDCKYFFLVYHSSFSALLMLSFMLQFLMLFFA